MHRSVFLKKLIASLAIGRLPVTVTKQFRKIYLLQCFVAGFRFYEGMQLLGQMKAGDLLELRREPANEHDECAIALYWQNNKIGYVPGDTNEMLSHLLDANALSLFAVITHLEKGAKPWEHVAIAVYFVQEADDALPAHASYLTRIEAPHYRTLHKKMLGEPEEDDDDEAPTMEQLFDTSYRVINLDEIPPHLSLAKKHFEENCPPITLQSSGNYVHVPTDDIYSYLYNIDDKIDIVTDDDGNKYFEFYLA
jgi:HIRAN domain